MRNLQRQQEAEAADGDLASLTYREPRERKDTIHAPAAGTFRLVYWRLLRYRVCTGAMNTKITSYSSKAGAGTHRREQQEKHCESIVGGRRRGYISLAPSRAARTSRSRGRTAGSAQRSAIAQASRAMYAARATLAAASLAACLVAP